jgi:uncharacterized protein (TIGR02118 family)
VDQAEVRWQSAGETPYFAVFEVAFADAEAMTAARASPEGQQVTTDVANYAAGGAVVIHHPVPDEARLT